MIAKQIGVVLCRVGAAILVVQALGVLSQFIPTLTTLADDIDLDLVVFVLTFFVPAALAVLLWVFADRISSIAGEGEQVSSPSSISPIDVVGIGTLLIGLYLFVDGVTTLIAVETSNLMQQGFRDDVPIDRERFAAQMFGWRLAWGFQIVLGISMILGRARIARLLWKARYAGS